MTINGRHAASTLGLLAGTNATGSPVAWTYIHTWRILDLTGQRAAESLDHERVQASDLRLGVRVVLTMVPPDDVTDMKTPPAPGM
jgi:hypothetical protein